MIVLFLNVNTFVTFKNRTFIKKNLAIFAVKTEHNIN